VERLRHSDLRRLVDFVAEAVTARFSDRGQVTQLAVDRLATLVPCDLAIVTAWDAPSRQLTTTATDEGLAALRSTQWTHGSPAVPSTRPWRNTNELEAAPGCASLT
jgi:hypothetical protein